MKRKRVTIIRYKGKPSEKDVCDIMYQIGGSPPLPWKWLSKIFTTWVNVSNKTILGLPTDEWVYENYGKDVEIRKLI